MESRGEGDNPISESNANVRLDTQSEIKQTDVNATNQHSESVVVDMASGEDVKSVPTKTPEDDGVKKEAKKPPQRREKPKDEVTFRTHLTTLAHISVVLFVYLIIKLAFRGNFDFFSWHPILMSVGYMLMMTEGLFAINKYNTYWRFKTKGGFRVRVHWIALSIGYSLSIIGFLIVYINKNQLNKNHFVSWHALFGLIALVSTFPPVINGTVLLYKKELARFVTKPMLVKFIHVISGTTSFVFGSLALVLSVYTKWFQRKSNGQEYIFWLGLIGVSYPLFWAIYGPSVKLVRVVREYFSQKED